MPLMPLRALPWHHWIHVIKWGDFPTWLAVVGGGLAAVVAVRQFGRQTRQLERRQAERIDVRLRDDGPVPDGAPPRQRPDPYDEDACYNAVVSNNSPRPILRAACRIEVPGRGSLPAWRVGQAIEVSGPMYGGRRWLLHDGRDRPAVEIIRAEDSASFVFPFRSEEHPGAEPTARFTDDTGLRWQIDRSLHLQKIRFGRWRW